MTAPNSVPASSAPRVNPLQRLWLRELGMERLWLRPAPQPVAAPAPQVVVSKTDSPAAEQAGGAVAPAPARDAIAVPPPAAAQSPAQAPAARAASPAPGLRNGPPPKPAPKVEAEEAAPAVIPVAERVKNANLDELREQVLACTACGLCNGRRHAVFGHGGQPTRWLVVGEAPGEQEDRQGQPFVGRSGQLLDAMLSAVGMSRERDVFIANVIKCRPPGNRNPKPEEIAACSPYLMRQIALLKPERILVLGRFAAQTLLGTDATIGSLRGRVHQMKTDEGREIPVVVSYHPAYLLRSPAEKARAWQDLQLAARQS
ncbi:uracil-DNA glycosylase [Achromobacter insuavis]|uniref:Type-4 uracil-DNA glycosylase n=1 Tax=Achromobacter insuavis AXX-A TaxID=1003200 RepID=F7T3J4_9BURK|nr:uracil-DNA glycosylase [Achromobacter insuavis]EGP45110.1 uracil DNA glycosylase superfamily protein [Achromobacter insuavis AXX-A]